MRYALISDIHANLPALEAVLEDLERPGSAVEATYHLGDLVGYAPWPDETVALLRARSIRGISGNYDSTVATNYRHCGCRYEDPRQEALSHESYAWTLARTSVTTKGDPDVQFVRIPYDIDRAAKAILASELPHEYAETLRAGGVIASPVREPAKPVPAGR